jgi:deoxyribonuclease (pyrimidine dimer)
MAKKRAFVYLYMQVCSIIQVALLKEPMTRINLVPPSELADQHLFAEFREIKMVPKALSRSLKARGLAGVLKAIPPAFTLNTGHVMFFYDKGFYLRKRYNQLQRELLKRDIDFDIHSPLDPDRVWHALDILNQDYTPTPEALAIIRSRIAEKIAMKPTWYRWSKVATSGANSVPPWAF